MPTYVIATIFYTEVILLAAPICRIITKSKHGKVDGDLPLAFGFIAVFICGLQTIYIQYVTQTDSCWWNPLGYGIYFACIEKSTTISRWVGGLVRVLYPNAKSIKIGGLSRSQICILFIVAVLRLYWYLTHVNTCIQQSYTAL